MKLPYQSSGWKTAPISPTCEFLESCNKPLKRCGKPTDKAYPCQGGGWMALCSEHGKKHKLAPSIEELIVSGEKFE